MNILNRFSFSTNFVRGLKSFTSSQKDLPKGINHAVLSGTVSQIFPPKPEGLLLFLKTYDEHQFYTVHRVMIPGYVFHKIPPISMDQKLLVRGKMRVKFFSVDNGKRATSIEVKARQIFVCDTGDNKLELNDETAERSEQNSSAVPANETGIANENENEERLSNSPETVVTKDMNQVEVYDQICFEIVHHRDYSMFFISSQYKAASSISGVDEEHVDFLPIFVYDKELREYVRNNLKRLDRVRVDGYLKTKNKKDDQGIVRKTSYIEAFRLNKMVSIHRVVDDAGSRKEKLSETQAK